MWIGRRAAIDAEQQRQLTVARTTAEMLAKELVEARTDRDRERTQRELLARELAIKQQNMDWLTMHVNRMETERGILLERVLGVSLPIPEITRAPGDHDAVPLNVGLGAPIPERDRLTGQDVGVAAAALGLSSFEDMGDTLAERLGVTHDSAGNAIYP